MSIPRQVVAGAAEAEAYLQQVREAEKPSPEPIQDPKPEAPAPAAPPPEKDWKAEAEKAQQRWTVADTMLKRIGQDVREKDAKIAQLESALAAAKAAPPPPAKPAPDLEIFNEEAREVVGYLAKQELAPLQREVETLRSEREANRAQAERQAKQAAAMDVLDDLVPDWREIDNDPGFASYLIEVDHTGQQRQVAFMEAVNAFDGTTMARVFKRYIAQKPPAPPQAPSPPIVPPPAGHAPPVTEPLKKVWSAKEADDLLQDANRGRLKARGWTQKQIEDAVNEVFAAYAEGRVR